MIIRTCVATAVLLAAVAAAAAECKKGPLYCRMPDFSDRLEAKKTRLARDGAPSRLLALLDHGGSCQGCLDTAPDGFTILNVLPNGDNYTIAWDPTNEAISHRKATAGELKVYYIFNSRLGCVCDDDVEPSRRADYDPALKLNHDSALACHGGAASPACP